MAQSTVKERLAALQAKKANVTKEAKVAVVAAWTVAKTLLPEAPAEIQHRFASAIVELDTKILKSALRQTAVNSFWSKFAEDMEADGCGLNKFVDDESMLNKLKGEIKRELQGQAKNASECEEGDLDKDATGVPEVKVPNESQYDHDAPKFANEGEEGLEPKTAEYTDPAQEQEQQDAADKAALADQIAQTEQAVENLEDEIDEENQMVSDGMGLDLDKLFDATDDKVDDLANEGDGDFGGDGSIDGLLGDEDGFDFGGEPGQPGEDQFGPSATSSLEGALDGMDEVELSDTADFFSQTAGEEDSFDGLFSSSAETVEVEVGEAADFFANSAVGNDDFGPEEDHDNDIIWEVMKDIKPDSYKSKRDTEPHLETPKKASRPIRSLGHVTQESREQAMLANLVFGDDDF